MIMVLFIGNVTADSKGSATIYYSRGGMAEDLFSFIVSNDLKIPITMRSVDNDKKSFEMSTEAGKECKLKGVMLNAYPLLVYGRDCVVNDKNIMDYMQKNDMLSLRPMNCIKSSVVKHLHYPNLNCEKSMKDFMDGSMSSYHFHKECVAPLKLISVMNVKCQNAPMEGFPKGSVYQATACCGK